MEKLTLFLFFIYLFYFLYDLTFLRLNIKEGEIVDARLCYTSFHLLSIFVKIIISQVRKI